MNLGDPLAFSGTAELGIACAIALCTTMAVGRLVKTVGPPADAEKPLQLEHPLTKEKVSLLLKSWRERGALAAVKRWVYADFPLIVAYGVAIATAGSLAGRAAVAGLDSPDATKVGAVFTWAGFIAAALDVIENFGMLAMLRGRTSQPFPAATTVASTLKWLLIGIAVTGSLGLLIASAVAELI